MEMTGEYIIPAPRAAVWAALNDVNVLKAAIPGCETIAQVSDTQIEATVLAKVGPVKATFKGMVTLSEIDPPNGYTIRGEGKGGAAGFARGGAKVRLSDAAAGTKLSYTVDAAVGGKLAQLGSRLIDATAKKLADEFFTSFTAHVGGRPASSAATPPPVSPRSAAATETPKRDTLADFRPVGFGKWLLVLLVLALVVYVVTLI